MAVPKVFGMVLAGGEGKRLAPLTADRAKPAVPFAGHYRLIDFALSNLVNAGFHQIAVLTQYKSHSLDRHVATTWRLSPLLGNYVTSVPAQMRRGPRWFAGSADAIYQNLNLIRDERPDHVCVFSADHVYRMDPRQMVEQHIATGAGVTVAGIRVPVGEASSYGVIGPDATGLRIARFQEKPAEVEGLPGDPDHALVSMGNYVFTTRALVEAVRFDAVDEESAHDIGGSLIPALVEAGEAFVYDFATNEVPGRHEPERGYWRDVGTLDSYYEANMDLVSPAPAFDLYNQEWPILTWNAPSPPAKLVGTPSAPARAEDAMICAGAVVAGGLVRRSILSPGVRVEAGAVVEDAVLLHDVRVGPGAVVRRAIVDKNVVVPEGGRIGVDPDLDRARFAISPGGIAVIGKGQKVDQGPARQDWAP